VFFIEHRPFFRIHRLIPGSPPSIEQIEQIEQAEQTEQMNI
jgi:hypothetical protein